MSGKLIMCYVQLAALKVYKQTVKLVRKTCYVSSFLLNGNVFKQRRKYWRKFAMCHPQCLKTKQKYRRNLPCVIHNVYKQNKNIAGKLVTYHPSFFNGNVWKQRRKYWMKTCHVPSFLLHWQSSINKDWKMIGKLAMCMTMSINKEGSMTGKLATCHPFLVIDNVYKQRRKLCSKLSMTSLLLQWQCL